MNLLAMAVFVNAGFGPAGASPLGERGCTLVRELGLQGVRTDIHWDDQVVRQVIGEFAPGDPCNGLVPMFVLHGNSPASIEERALFTLYTIRELNIGRAYVEVLNEPDLNDATWKARPDLAAEAVARALMAWYVVGSPSNVVMIVGGVSNITEEHQRWAGTELQQLAKLIPDLSHFVMGWHDYRPADKPLTYAYPPFPSRIVETSAFLGMVKKFGLMRHGITEFGYEHRGITEGEVWRRVKYSLVYHEAVGAEFSVIYQLFDGPDASKDGRQAFGLVHVDGSLTITGQGLKERK